MSARLQTFALVGMALAAALGSPASAQTERTAASADDRCDEGVVGCASGPAPSTNGPDLPAAVAATPEAAPAELAPAAPGSRFRVSTCASWRVDGSHANAAYDGRCPVALAFDGRNLYLRDTHVTDPVNVRDRSLPREYPALFLCAGVSFDAPTPGPEGSPRVRSVVPFRCERFTEESPHGLPAVAGEGRLWLGEGGSFEGLWFGAEGISSRVDPREVATWSGDLTPLTEGAASCGTPPPFPASRTLPTRATEAPARGCSEAVRREDAPTTLTPALTSSPASATPSSGAAAEQRGCDAGHAALCGSLGARYLSGDGVAPDPRRAVPLLVRACRRGVASSCERLGEHFAARPGRASERNAREAFEAGCGAGSTAACGRLVELALRPRGRRSGTQSAGPSSLAAGCIAGDLGACAGAGEEASRFAAFLAATGQRRAAREAAARALLYFSVACRGGHEASCARPGVQR